MNSNVLFYFSYGDIDFCKAYFCYHRRTFAGSLVSATQFFF